MRAVWSQAARPKGIGRAARHGHRIESTAQSNPACHGFELRPVTFNDAFGIFLAPFLTAATLINLSWKEKQKKDWDEKFADIDKEIEALRAREKELSNNLQLPSVPRAATGLHRRFYSTAAATALIDPSEASYQQLSQMLDRIQAPTQVEKASTTSDARSHPTPTLPPILQALDRELASLAPTSDSRNVNILPQNRIPEHLWHFERLVAALFALKMRLQIHIDGPAQEEHPLAAHSTNPPPAQSNLEEVFKQLRQVTKLEAAAQRQYAFNTSFIGLTKSPELVAMSANIKRLGEEYRAGHLNSTGFIQNISHLILNAREPPNIWIYVQLVELLHRCRFDTIVPLVVTAVQRSMLALDEVAMVRILNHAAHSRDVKAFDWCLTEFTNARSRLSLSEQWEWRQIGSESLPMPTSPSPRLVKTLIRAALSLEQVWRAEAWVSLLSPDEGPGDYFDLIKAFLYYYTKHSDWQNGKIWILRAFKSPTLSGSDSFRSHKDFQVFIFRVLSLCAACGRRTEYSQILRAATAAGIRAPPLDTTGDGMSNERAKHVLDEWTRLLDHARFDRNMLDEDRIIQFQEDLRPSDLYKTDVEAQAQNSRTELPEHHESLEQLKFELAESQKHVEKQLHEIRGLQSNLQSLMSQYNNPIPKVAPGIENSQLRQQQIALDRLQDEVAQHRKLLETQKQSRHQEDSGSNMLKRQYFELQSQLHEMKQQSRGRSFHVESGDLRELESSAETAQMKKLEQKVASLTSLVEQLTGKAHATPPLPPSPSPAASADRRFPAGARRIKLSSAPSSSQSSTIPAVLEADPDSDQDPDSDSGYSSDSDWSDHNDSGQYRPPGSLPIQYYHRVSEILPVSVRRVARRRYTPETPPAVQIQRPD